MHSLFFGDNSKLSAKFDTFVNNCLVTSTHSTSYCTFICFVWQINSEPLKFLNVNSSKFVEATGFNPFNYGLSPKIEHWVAVHASSVEVSIHFNFFLSLDAQPSQSGSRISLLRKHLLLFCGMLRIQNWSSLLNM